MEKKKLTVDSIRILENHFKVTEPALNMAEYVVSLILKEEINIPSNGEKHQTLLKIPRYAYWSSLACA